ncbi:hypothetical protein Tco_1522467 [Tanacetum coccineum]
MKQLHRRRSRSRSRSRIREVEEAEEEANHIKLNCFCSDEYPFKGTCKESATSSHSIPASFHGHKMSGDSREVWINAGGRSPYMSVKVHIDKRLKTDMKTNVQLVGELSRLKDILE